MILLRQSFKGKCASHRWCSEPAILVLCAVHVPVEDVQLAVAQVICVHQVKLPTCIVVALIIPNTWEVQPLRMTKFITYKQQEMLKSGEVHIKSKCTCTNCTFRSL